MAQAPDSYAGLLSLLSTHGRDWIVSQRQSHRPHGRTLPAALRSLLAPYFRPETLESVRFVIVPALENPSFYESPEMASLPVPPLDFTEASALTFIDTIAIAEARYPKTESERTDIFFHECVHAVQYRTLGLDGFIDAYVNGWARNGFTYAGIPLERQAYRFGHRMIETSPVAFPAEDEIVAELAAGEAGEEASPVR